MRRVVVTGLGAVSCIGNSQQEILDALKNGRSGIVFNESVAQMGLRSQVSGTCQIDPSEHIDRKVFRFMGDAAAYSYISMQQAVEDSGLEESDISNVRTGLIAASGGASAREIVRAADVLRDRGVRKIGPYAVTKTMSSSISA
jgi:3-oxoacyl-[acyl-carrier-protein] synthase-1